MKKFFRQSEILVLCLFLSASFFCEESFADDRVIAETESRLSLEMWRYSGSGGGKWRMGTTGGEKYLVTDEDLSRSGLGAILANQYVDFTQELPESVKKAVAEGKMVRVEAEAVSTPLSSLVEMSTMEMYMDGGTLYFVAKPKFNISARSGSYPLIDHHYGKNLYSVFGNGLYAAKIEGWFDEKNPDDYLSVPQGFLHPKQIASNGKIQDGVQLFTMGHYLISKGLSVGQGTFNAGGAIGMEFDYNIRFIFYETESPALAAPLPPADLEEVVYYPQVSAGIRGSQKQNRKMTMSIKVATKASAPLENMSISFINDEYLKTKKPIIVKQDDFYTYYEMDMQSSASAATEYSYVVKVKDKKKNEAEFQGSFWVLPDEEPVAEIKCDERFYRDSGTNTKRITAESSAKSPDGDDLIFSWFIDSGSGFHPLSDETDFSSNAKQSEVSFLREGVGKFSLKLMAEELMDGETIHEFLEPGYTRSSEAVKEIEIDNVAPVVNAELAHSKTADIILVAENKSLENKTEEMAKDLRFMLSGKNISANIGTAVLAEESSSISVSGSDRAAFGHRGAWSGFWEEGCEIVDQKAVYTAQAKWVKSGTGSFSDEPVQPYTIKAFDSSDGKRLWTLNITERMYKAPDAFKNAVFRQDALGKYLFIVDNGKTIVINKANGLFETVWDFAVPENSAYFGGFLYLFEKDGIFSFSQYSGQKTLIADKKLLDNSSVYAKGNQISFLCKGGGRLQICTFDTEKESLAIKSCEESYGTDNFKFVCFDSAGNFLCVSDGTVYKRDIDGRVIGKRAVASGHYTPVYDRNGIVNYFVVRVEKDYCSSNVLCYDLNSDWSKNIGVSGTNNCPTDVRRLLYATEDENGVVYVGTGAQYRYIYDTYTIEPERAYEFCFNHEADTAAKGLLSKKRPELPDTAEYGCFGGGTWAISTAANVPDGAAYRDTYILTIGAGLSDFAGAADLMNYEKDYSIVKQISEDSDTESVLLEIEEEISLGRKLLLLDDSENEITKQLSLEPGKRYFYEYDSDVNYDSFGLKTGLEPDGNSSYSVTAVHSADFNTDNADTIFKIDSNRVENGRYRMAAACSYHIYNPDSNYSFAKDSSSIEFSIPEGQYAVLSFDYDIYNHDGVGNGIYLGKKGQTQYNIDINVYGSGFFKGKYMHHSLLDSGTYTLTGVAMTNSYNESTVVYYTDIDNLKLYMLSDGDNGISDAGKSETEKVGDHYHIRGYFNLPFDISCFRQYKDIEYINTLNSRYSSYSTSQFLSDTKTLKITVPQGKTLLWTAIQTHSIPTQSEGSFGNNDVSYTWKDKTWTAGIPKQASAEQNRIINDYILVDSFRSGKVSTSLKSTYKSRNGANSDFADFKLVVCDTDCISSIPQPVSELQFFLKDGKMYYPDLFFDGKTEAVFTAKGQSISNLKIYFSESDEDALSESIILPSEENRLYIDAESFKSDRDLNGWNDPFACAKIFASPKITEEKSDNPLVFRKGEFVDFLISYADFENDPSKSSHYMITHKPLNDGLYEHSGIELDYIPHYFSKDGEYLFTHWQFDDSGRNGASIYDKMSNIASVSFYILPDEDAELPLIVPDPPIPVDPRVNPLSKLRIHRVF